MAQSKRICSWMSIIRLPQNEKSLARSPSKNPTHPTNHQWTSNGSGGLRLEKEKKERQKKKKNEFDKKRISSRGRMHQIPLADDLGAKLSPRPFTIKRASITCDEDGLIVTGNEAVRDIWGFPPASVLGRHVKVYLVVEKNDKLHACLIPRVFFVFFFVFFSSPFLPLL